MIMYWSPMWNDCFIALIIVLINCWNKFSKLTIDYFIKNENNNNNQ